MLADERRTTYRIGAALRRLGPALAACLCLFHGSPSLALESSPEEAIRELERATKKLEATSRSEREPSDDSESTEGKQSGALPALSVNRSTDSIGSLSVGHPHAGYLFNAVRMPESPLWVLSDPKNAWGTEETIYHLTRCIRRVHEQFPGAAPVVIGSISAQHGGALPPHKSHRTGRDADVYFFRKGEGVKIFKAATAEDLDREKTWALLRTFATESDVEYVLIDQKIQRLLEDYALSIGEDPTWVSELFHGRGKYEFPLVKHIPGHVAHMHVRFVSRGARERGRAAYDRLVEQGHIKLPSRGLRHRVVRGDTLIGIAKKYKTTVRHIMEENELSSSLIRTGQTLQIERPQDLRDARAPVIVPWRPLPPPRRATTNAQATLSGE